VFGIGGDPVALGLVESFSRPGGNATGVTLLTNLMEPKRLGLLRELVPGVPLIGVLLNPKFAPASRQLQQVEEAARSIDQRILVANASTDGELETAFAALTSERAALCWSRQTRTSTRGVSRLSALRHDTACPPSINFANMRWRVDCSVTA
jgi:ABC-type uncharacterized transport system substrate-binding protein